MYTIKEIGLADNRRLVQYNVDEVFGSKFYLKGFEYPWILSSREWKAGEKILDVGAAYSPLPIHIADTYDCQVWAVDDFGSASDDEFWLRNQNPQEHIQAYPQVKYVMERLGDPAASSLPEGFFDCIYSASTLEHVPKTYSASVWRHMDQLLKPGGCMLHAIDIGLRTTRGVLSIAKSLLLEWLGPLLPPNLKASYSMHTPRLYAYNAFHALGLNARPIRSLPNALQAAIQPEIMLESPKTFYHRVVKDNLTPATMARRIALLLHLEKHPEKGN
ncbi:MAG: class I SAM-dependent methyltransferase [Anaerolineales bacterium]|jgi:2-polyprenyl-3-methyl-5-hydroxy-6-metoxy-1,4-benzoquinol methylase